VAARIIGRVGVRRLAWVAAVLVTATLAMFWMSAHRPPHPGSPLAARLAALRGLWPADRRDPLLVLGAAVLVAAVDGVVVVLLLRGRRRPLARRGGVALATLATLVVLQGLHQTEHLVQVIQLLITGGNADLAQGVVTRFNQEVIHLAWTSGVWLLGAALLLRFRDNRWLWLAVAVASVHEVEHLYLYLVSLQPAIALHGGVNGILAKGGLAGGPLQRPYLHFLYNLLELVPLVAALLDELAAAGPRDQAQRAERPLRMRSARA
jgi:hypothetical protein